jgi:hypothetical protein
MVVARYVMSGRRFHQHDTAFDTGKRLDRQRSTGRGVSLDGR